MKELYEACAHFTTEGASCLILAGVHLSSDYRMMKMSYARNVGPLILDF